MRCSGRWRRTASAAPHSAARRAGSEPSTLTARGALHRFLDGGFEALADAPRPGRPPRWKREDLDALEDMLDASAAEGRIRTLPALAEWLRRERGVDLDSSWLSVLLHRDGFRWKRTRDSIRHQADPALQAAAWERLEVYGCTAGLGMPDRTMLGPGRRAVGCGSYSSSSRQRSKSRYSAQASRLCSSRKRTRTLRASRSAWPWSTARVSRARTRVMTRSVGSQGRGTAPFRPVGGTRELAERGHRLSRRSPRATLAHPGQLPCPFVRLRRNRPSATRPFGP
ncbi:winged helix-turn-helix domain-containing protein [Streptomyces sp. NPDC020719]|uniref:winged helix-turn-helix domain-containing protein n=1 Tax=Streptomyces sp. NPDC020719 TaxID=3154896 RepID=UPI0033F40439